MPQCLRNIKPTAWRMLYRTGQFTALRPQPIAFMATIGGVKGDASATEAVRRDGRSELTGRIRIRSDDYPRVGDWLTTFEPVEYRGPIERDGKRTTESRSVVLRRVDAHDGSEVSVYFENAERGAGGDTLCTPSGDRVFTGVAGCDGQT
jgi:hypothetical protein